MHLRISLLALLATAATSMAGGFFGPPPFDNGAPTSQGTDGTYQATAVGTNLTGIITFVISGGQQVVGTSVTVTSTTSGSTSATGVTQNNSWVFFVDGQAISGSPIVSVQQGKVTGVLDSAGTNLNGIQNQLENGGVFAADIPDNSAGGTFTASMDMNSPVLAFSGTGTLQGTVERTDQLIVVQAINVNALQGNFFLEDIPLVSSSTLAITIPGSDLTTQSFRLNGTRVGDVNN